MARIFASTFIASAGLWVASVIEAVMGNEKAAGSTKKHLSRPVVFAVTVAYFIAAVVFTYVKYGYKFSWISVFLGGDPLFFVRLVQVLIVSTVVAMGIVSWVAVTIYIVAALIAAPTSFLVGRELVVAGLYLDVDVETAPPGRCQMVQLATHMGGTSLQHSTHSNRAAIRYVAAWLASRARSQPVRGAPAPR
jgi:hypothetical protein